MKAAASTRAGPRKRAGAPSPFAAGTVVAVSAFVAYVRSFDFEFTYDDHHHFVQNPFVQNLANIRQFLPWRYFESEFPDQVRPLLVSSHFLDRALGGTSAVCHAQSAFWHALAALLLFALARRLGWSTRAAGFGGVLFAIHPVAVEAVAGISNREDVISAAFVLVSLLAIERFFRGSRAAFAIAVLCYALALLAKESALSLPFLLLVLALTSPRFRPRARARRAWLALALAGGIVTLAFLGFMARLGAPSLLPGAGGSGLENASHAPWMPGVRALVAWQATDTPTAVPAPPPRRLGPRKPQGEISLADAPALEALRAWQVVVPWPTAPEYDLAPWRTPLARLLGSAALLALAYAFVRDRARRGRVALGIGWFFAATLPVSVPTLLLNPLADRYLYLPAAGAMMSLAWLVAEELPARLQRPTLAGPLMLALALGYLALFSLALMRWKDDVSLFSAATAAAPSSARAQQNLGSALLKKERYVEAETALARALELDPGLLAARVNLGLLEEIRGRDSEALHHYRAAVSAPSLVAEEKLRARACERLGSLLMRTAGKAEIERTLAAEQAAHPGSGCTRALQRSLQ